MKNRKRVNSLMKSKKGMTLVEVILAMALLSMVSVVFLTSFAAYNRFISNTKSITEDVFGAQESMELKIKELKDKIKAEDPLLPAPNTYPLFTGADAISVQGFPITLPVLGKNVTTIVATNQMLELPAPSVENVVATLKYNGTAVKRSYAASANTSVDGTYTIVDPDGNLFLSQYQWYVSRTGFNIPKITSPLEIEMGRIYPKYPDDYMPIPGATAKTLTNLSAFTDCHLVFTVTPVSKTFKMGNTGVSEPVYVSGPPDLTNLALHLDSSLIDKENTSEVRIVNPGAENEQVFTSKWNDLSGLLTGTYRNALQATDANQPLLQEVAYRNDIIPEVWGKSLLANVAGSSTMSVPNFSSNSTISNMTVIVVARTSQTNTDMPIIEGSYSDYSWNFGWQSDGSLGFYIKDSDDDEGVVTQSSGKDGKWHVFSGVLTNGTLTTPPPPQVGVNTGSLTYYVDGTEVSSPAHAAELRSDTLTINTGNADVAEILVYKGSFNFTSVRDYLEEKYNPTDASWTIDHLEDKTDTAIKNSVYTLPSKANAIMTNGSSQYVDVVWNPASIDTSTNGVKTAIGTAILDPSKTMTLTVNVYGISYLDNISTSTQVGLPYTMPATVVAHLDGPGNPIRSVGVFWNPSGIDTSEIGTQTSIGTCSIDSTKTMTLTVAVTGIPVTSVSLSPTSLSLLVGNVNNSLVATISPANAANKSVTWSSSNNSVATVSGTGVVTAVAAGSATIRVTTVDGGKTASCAVTVLPSTCNLNGMTLERSYQQSNWPFNTVWTGAPYSPVFSTSTVSYSSTVASSSTNIRLNWTIPSGATSSCTVTRGTSTNNYTMGSTYDISGSRTGPYTFRITVYWTGYPGSSRVYTLVVIDNAVAVTGVNVTPSTMTLTKGNTGNLTATVSPANATNQTVNWTSSNTGVATVSSTGVVTAVTVGTARITATTVDGGFTDYCDVTVQDYALLSNLALRRSSNGNAIAISPAFSSSQLTYTASTTYTPVRLTLAATYPGSTIQVRLNNGTTQNYDTNRDYALNVGTNTFTITVSANGYVTRTYTLTVTRIQMVTGVNVTPSTMTLTKGNTGNLTATVTPTDATNQTVNWTSSNTNIATVSNAGVVTAVAVGTARITATAADGSGISDYCDVTVQDYALLSNLALRRSSNGNAIAISPAFSSSQLTYTASTTYTPVRLTLAATYPGSTIQVRLNNGTTQNYDTNRDYALNVGTNTFTITVSANGYVTRTYTLTVTRIQMVTGVNVTPATLTLIKGNTGYLTATVAPADATNQTVNWASSNNNIATVSSTGVVTAVAVGTARITATTADGGFTDYCDVTVQDYASLSSMTLERQNGGNYNTIQYSPTFSSTVYSYTASTTSNTVYLTLAAPAGSTFVITCNGNSTTINTNTVTRRSFNANPSAYDFTIVVRRTGYADCSYDLTVS